MHNQIPQEKHLHVFFVEHDVRHTYVCKQIQMSLFDIES